MSTLRDLIAQLDAVKANASRDCATDMPRDWDWRGAIWDAYPKLREVAEAAAEYEEAWKEYDFISTKDAVPSEVEEAWSTAHDRLVASVTSQDAQQTEKAP